MGYNPIKSATNAIIELTERSGRLIEQAFNEVNHPPYLLPELSYRNQAKTQP